VKFLGPVLATLYLAAVVALTVAAFDFAGSIRLPWILILIAATLPFSLVAWLGAWGLIHGTQLGCFAFYFLMCAGINVAIVARLVARLRTPAG
jgi:hypothetical protein